MNNYDSVALEYYIKESYEYKDALFNPYSGIVRGGSTPDAFDELLTGGADVIFCAQPSKEQYEAISETGLKLNMTPIGKEAFVFFVHHENPVKGLTRQQIRDIYSGKTTNWKDVGGQNKSIRAFQRPNGSGSQTMLLHIMGETETMRAPTRDRVAGMGGIIERTASYKNHGNAIGYSFLFFTKEMVKNNEIRVLDVDGVTPSTTTITDGTYPFVGDFYAITLGEPKANVKRLIDWILSEQGQELVRKTGYIPIN